MPKYRANILADTFEELLSETANTRSRYDVTHPTDKNNANASWAATALIAYRNIVGGDEVETSIADLLGDLMHLCDAAHLEFDELLDKARWHYTAELAGED